MMKTLVKSLSALPGLLASCFLAASILMAPLPAGAVGGSDVMNEGLVRLFFHGTTFNNIAENDSTTPATQIFVSLHSADPGAAAAQTASECAYTGYARVGVARSAGGWTITGNSASPAAAIDFPEATGSSCAWSHVCLGELASGAGDTYLCVAVSPTQNIGAGMIPRIPTSSTFTIN